MPGFLSSIISGVMGMGKGKGFLETVLMDQFGQTKPGRMVYGLQDLVKYGRTPKKKAEQSGQERGRVARRLRPEIQYNPAGGQLPGERRRRGSLYDLADFYPW